MAISDDLIRQAIVRLSSITGIVMDPDALAEDAFCLSLPFDDEREYLAAILSTERTFKLLLSGAVTSSKLEGNRAGWMSYRYQHSVAQHQVADCRIEWRHDGDAVYVRGFGHRWRPVDFYKKVGRR